ncbi:MAG: hypothetical protein RL517_1205 [Pseudomonadota bacterium]|jgi:hypothetical protein
MIVANLYHIKSTNGLYFYGLDYLRENIDLITTVLVRPELELHFRNAMPAVKVVACSFKQYLAEIVSAIFRADLIYTPTPHPLPLITRQWIVLHDAYPFEVGPKSKLKLFLLRWSLALSNCRVGYINRSEALPFVLSLGVASKRLFFAPNRFPEPSFRVPQIRIQSSVKTVGLLGTDSAKKNYDHLFCAVRAASLSSRLKFRVYGHDSIYFRTIQEKFSDIQITLVKSDEASIDEFMSGVDVFASASDKEGFGRPIAFALLAGLPVELLDRPVFREFFTAGAGFHTDFEALVEALVSSVEKNEAHTPYIPPTNVLDAYASANEEIRILGSNTNIR